MVLSTLDHTLSTPDPTTHCSCRGKNMEGEALKWLRSSAEAGLPDAIKRSPKTLNREILNLFLQ